MVNIWLAQGCQLTLRTINQSLSLVKCSMMYCNMIFGFYVALEGSHREFARLAQRACVEALRNHLRRQKRDPSVLHPLFTSASSCTCLLLVLRVIAVMHAPNPRVVQKVQPKLVTVWFKILIDLVWIMLSCWSSFLCHTCTVKSEKCCWVQMGALCFLNSYQ